MTIKDHVDLAEARFWTAWVIAIHFFLVFAKLVGAYRLSFMQRLAKAGVNEMKDCKNRLRKIRESRNE